MADTPEHERELDGDAASKALAIAFERVSKKRSRIDRIVQRIAELPDRTSPVDWPDAMLVTGDELRRILEDERDEAEARCCPEDVGFEEYIATLRKEIAIDNQLLAERDRLLDLFVCERHGKGCVPDAIRQVKALRRLVRVGLEEGWGHDDCEIAKELIRDAVPAS